MVRRIVTFARGLRKDQTAAEKWLWEELRNRNLGGYKFLRQYPIRVRSAETGRVFDLIADFYCAQAKLLVELDGPIHDDRKEKDAKRDQLITEHGMHTLRFRNSELEHMDSVKRRILEALERLIEA